MNLPFEKWHGLGNDFVLVLVAEAGEDPPALARAICDRHRGLGADGLILYTLGDRVATMDLYNADGSPSELSGNGLRCLAALLARAQVLDVGTVVMIDTGAGRKTLELLEQEGERYTFSAALGPPEGIRRETLEVDGAPIDVTVLTMGNPQCVILGPLPDAPTFGRLGAALAVHPAFAAGTNVGFAHVESPERVRILIWERGVGPTTASGTGASAAAVAASTHGGASREVDVVSPGGTQRVAWRDDGVFLTGWADIVFEGHWIPEHSGSVPPP